MLGKLISVSGLDGAGKTTQLELLKDSLSQRGIHCASEQFDAEHFGERGTKAVQAIADSGAQVVFTRLCIDWTGRYPLIRDFVYDASLQTPGMAMAVTAVFAGGSVQAYEACIRPLIERGIHVVCDRFWFDDLVFRGPWVDESIVRSLYRGVPHPNLGIVIDAPPAVIWDRNTLRQDGKSPLMSSTESIARLRSRFLSLAAEESLVVLDGRKPPDAVGAELVSLVLRQIAPDLTLPAPGAAKQ